MDLSILFVLVLVFAFSWYYFNSKGKSSRIAELVNEIPGPNILPIVGTTLPLLCMERHEVFTYLRSLPKNFGPIFRTWHGSLPLVNIADAQYAEIILSSSIHINKGFIYRYLLPWLGDGLLTSTGAKWHRHRKLITPAFHFKILETFVEIFVEKSKILTNMLSNEAGKNKPFNIFPYITHCTLDMITETAMGIQMDVMSQGKSKYVEAIYGLAEEIVRRFMTSWLSSDFVYYKTKYGKNFLKYLSVLHNTTNKVIYDRKRTLTDNKVEEQPETPADDYGSKKRDAFLDILLKTSQDGSVLTHEQIREEVDTFMFEGHDTTTASICWTIFLLGLHPDIQEEAYKEVSQVLVDNKSLTFSEINELKYLERIIKESLRLYPSVTTISRRIFEDIQIENYTIPAGATASIQIHDIHRNEKYYPEPNKFDPDRFLSENCKNRHPYAYIPFSAGPRNCIGQKFALTEEKVLLSYIVKNFKIKSMQTVDNVYPVTELICRPKEGLFVELEKRK